MVAALRDFPLAALRRAAFVWIAGATTVTIGVGLALGSQHEGLPLAVLPAAIGVPAWLAITRRTGIALAVLLLYLGLVDGVVKLRTGGQAATLGRDVLLYALAIGMAVRLRGPIRLPALGGWVLAWIAVVVVQLANPGNSSISHAVVSLRQDLEFVPLFFIGYAALRTRASLHTLFALLLVVATVNGAVAAYQGSLTPAQLAAWGPGYASLITGPDARLYETAGGQKRIRPPALGSDEGFAGNLGATALPGGIVLLMAYRRRKLLRALIVLGIIGAGIAVLTSQARSSLVMAVVAVFAVLALIAVGRQFKRAVIALILVAMLVAVAVEVVGSYNSSTFARYGSIAPGSAASTIYGSRSNTWSLTPTYMSEIPFGAGLGKVGPAATKAGGTPSTWNAESEFNFLIVEAGIPALLVLLAFYVALTATVVRGLRRERDFDTVVLIAGLAGPLYGYAVGWLVGVYTTETPSAPYLWLATGVISWWLVRRQQSMEPAARAAGLDRPLRGRDGLTAGAVSP